MPKLSDRITMNLDDEHVVDFGDEGFAIQHPLSERTELDSLLDCPLNSYLSSFNECPVEETGRYVVKNWGRSSSSLPMFTKIEDFSQSRTK